MVNGRSPGLYWGVVLDAPDARALARFYARLLDWTIMKDEPDFVTVAPPDGVAYLAVQTQQAPDHVAPVWSARAGQQQMQSHLDIEVHDLDSAVAGALELGATLAGFQPQDEVRVLLDPVGHPFCLYLDGQPGDRQPGNGQPA